MSAPGFRLLPLLLLAVWPAPAVAGGQREQALPVPAASTQDLAQLVAGGRHADLRWPDFSDVQADLERAYTARGWAPLWFSGETLTSAAHALIRVLEEAASRGLDPTDYDAAWLATQAAVPDREAAVRVDAALSVAAARFALALRRGRISPAILHATFRLPRAPFALDSTLLDLASSDRPQAILRSLEPPFLDYWLLMAALARYRALSRDSALVVLPPMPRRLRPGESYQGVTRLRRLLWLLGDYRDSLPLPFTDSSYTGEVVEAVKRFQMRQGFAPDGVIGDSTRGRLVRPFDQRIRQMELTLERWRWMPRQFSTPPIIVNIPAFQLYGVSSVLNGEVTPPRMNVVVGQAFQSETPVFAADMTYLVFSPYWDVPPSIALNEIKPPARKDPEFLTRNRYELVERGEPVLPWPENVERIGQGVRVRQIPGPHNALGGVKFIMPNENNVYLHDTPSRQWFERTRRDASHGCIRLGDPLALAKYVLRDRPDWPEERIREAMRAAEPLRVNLTRPIPVFVVYATALARSDGEVYFYPDIYGHDRTLDRLLRKGYPYPREGAAVTATPARPQPAP